MICVEALVTKSLKITLVAIVGLLSLTALLADLDEALAASPAANPAPNYSGVTDILGGRRLIFPDDDLFVTQVPTNLNGDVSNIYVKASGDKFTGGLNTVNDIAPPSNFATGIGRMYNLPYDVIVTVLGDGIYSSTNNQQFSFPTGIGGQPTQNVIAKADFTGDGFDDFAFIDTSHGAIQIFTAADVNDQNKGFVYATPVPLPAGTMCQGPLAALPCALAAGDFDGSGVNELALASMAQTGIEIDVYKPQVTTGADGKISSLSLTHIGQTLIADSNAFSLTLTAGVYSGATASNGILLSQLVVMYGDVLWGPLGSYEKIHLQPINIAPATPPDVTLTLANNYTFPGRFHTLLEMQIKSGYLDFSSNTEQLVAMQQQDNSRFNQPRYGTLYVLTLDSSLNISQASSLTGGFESAISGSVFWTDIGLGNFDQPSALGASLSLEVAILNFVKTSPENNCTTENLEIVHIDPANNFKLSPVPGSETLIGLENQCWVAPLYSLDTELATGDIQGRSAVLGTPSVFQVQHIDPQLVLGAPPTHIDYITPDGKSPPEVFNVSAVPLGFFPNTRPA